MRSVIATTVGAARMRVGGDRRALLYHRVEPSPKVGDPWSVSVEAFVRQLDIVAALGYRAVDLARVRSWPGDGRGREVLIAFDDGYRSVLEHAVPVLRERGLAFACFLVPGAMGGMSTWEREMGLEPSPLMDWPDVVLLREAGATVGSHSMTHCDLRSADAPTVSVEVRQSRSALWEHGIDANVFSVPFGRDDARIAPALEAAGYAVKLSNQLIPLARQGNLLLVPCTAILRDDDEAEFKRKLVGAYDWLNAIDRRRYPPTSAAKEQTK